MVAAVDSVLERLSAAGVRQVAVTWDNHAGETLVKVVPLRHLPEAISKGVGFSPVSDAFRSDGVIDGAHRLARPDGDLRLRADLESLAMLEPQLGWAWAAGERWDRNSGPYAADQRHFCRRMEAALADSGWRLRAGFELEWVVVVPGADGTPQAVLPGGPYGADRLIEGLDYASALLKALDDAEVPWLQFHPEYGPSQFELSFAPDRSLTIADHLIRARLVIQRVTRRFGWYSSFSAKPRLDWVGNGGHLHLSVLHDQGPILQGGQGIHGLKPEGEALIAGLLEQLPSLMALASPSPVSYLRLVPSSWSAPFQVWGVENREAALRLVPSAADGCDAHLEIKAVDPTTNPYLLLGALQAQVKAALERPRVLPPAQIGDPAAAPGSSARRLPSSLLEARDALAADHVLEAAMGPLLHGSLLDSLAAEIQRVQQLPVEDQVSGCCWWPLVGGLV